MQNPCGNEGTRFTSQGFLNPCTSEVSASKLLYAPQCRELGTARLAGSKWDGSELEEGERASEEKEEAICT